MFASDRPYAVQMLYMGFPGTMGADFIDYLVTDHVVSPAHLEWCGRPWPRGAPCM